MPKISLIAKVPVKSQETVYEPGSLPEHSLAEPLTLVKNLMTDLYALTMKIHHIQETAQEGAKKETDEFFADRLESELESEDWYADEMDINFRKVLADVIIDLQDEAQDILDDFETRVTSDADFEELIRAADVAPEGLVSNLTDIIERTSVADPPNMEEGYAWGIEEMAKKLHELIKSAVPDDAYNVNEEFYDSLDLSD
jgi:hypothetical protein